MKSTAAGGAPGPGSAVAAGAVLWGAADDQTLSWCWIPVLPMVLCDGTRCLPRQLRLVCVMPVH